MKSGAEPKTIFLTCYRNQDAEDVIDRLRRLHGISGSGHLLVDDPNDADLILVGGIGNEMCQAEYIEETLCHPLIDLYPNKSFTISHRDTPVLFNRGVYESAVNSAWNRGRCLTGSYSLSGTFNNRVGSVVADCKDLLFSFVGRNSHPCRQKLFSLRFSGKEQVWIEDSSDFHYWDCSDQLRSEREHSYARVLSRSKFCLCPRGAGAGSIRLFEAMRAGVAPVVISDRWIWPTAIPWDTFAITVKETQLAQLESRVLEREPYFEKMGVLARAAWENWFSDAAYFDYIVDGCLAMRREQPIPEAFYWASRKLFARGTRLSERLRGRLNRIRGRLVRTPHG